jgi:hypothetical protein
VVAVVHRHVVHNNNSMVMSMMTSVVMSGCSGAEAGEQGDDEYRCNELC